MWFYIQLRLKSELRLDSESNLKDKIKAVTAVLVEVRQISQRQMLPCQLLLVKVSPTTLVFKIYHVSLCGGYWWGLWWLVYAKQFCMRLSRFFKVVLRLGFGLGPYPDLGMVVWCSVVLKMECGENSHQMWIFTPQILLCLLNICHHESIINISQHKPNTAQPHLSHSLINTASYFRHMVISNPLQVLSLY